MIDDGEKDRKKPEGLGELKTHPFNEMLKHLILSACISGVG
jgi:hypothetical protein